MRSESVSVGEEGEEEVGKKTGSGWVRMYAVGGVLEKEVFVSIVAQDIIAPGIIALGIIAGFSGAEFFHQIDISTDYGTVS